MVERAAGDEVGYEADYAAGRSRLSAVVRAAPAAVVWAVMIVCTSAGLLASIAAWLGIVVTGRYPRRLHSFNAGVLRQLARGSSYSYLMTDQFPPLGFREEAGYPVRVSVAERRARYSRRGALLRPIAAIPVYLLLCLTAVATWACAAAAWVTIVVRGRCPRGLHGVLVRLMRFMVRGNAYGFAMLTQSPPPRP